MVALSNNIELALDVAMIFPATVLPAYLILGPEGGSPGCRAAANAAKLAGLDCWQIPLTRKWLTDQTDIVQLSIHHAVIAQNRELPVIFSPRSLLTYTLDEFFYRCETRLSAGAATQPEAGKSPEIQPQP